MGTCAYLSYLLGEFCNLSGIVSLFCTAVIMSHYALHSITKEHRRHAMSVFETLSVLSEGMIFLYVGLDSVDPVKWEVGGPARAHEVAGAHDGEPQ